MLWPRPCLSTSWRRSLATSLERSNMKSQGYLSTYQRIDLLRIFSAYFRRTSPFSPLCNVKGRLRQLQGSWGLPQRSFQDIPIWLNIRLRNTSYQYPEFASKRYPIRPAVLWGSRYVLLLPRKAIVLKCFSQPSWLTIRMEEIWITRLKLNYNKLTLLPSHNFIKLYFIFYQINNFFDHLIKTV